MVFMLCLSENWIWKAFFSWQMDWLADKIRLLVQKFCSRIKQDFQVLIFWGSVDPFRNHVGWKWPCFIIWLVICVIHTQNISGHRKQPETSDQLWFWKAYIWISTWEIQILIILTRNWVSLLSFSLACLPAIQKRGWEKCSKWGLLKSP